LCDDGFDENADGDENADPGVVGGVWVGPKVSTSGASGEAPSMVARRMVANERSGEEVEDKAEAEAEEEEEEE